MILVDFNQVLIGNLMMQVGSNPNIEIKEDLVRHMVLNTLLSYRKKFSKEYGELVLCIDYTFNYWRKDHFKYYKATRKKKRKESPFDWELIYQTLNKIRDEVRETFPYKVIQVEDAEADDIIAVLSKKTQNDDLVQAGLIQEKKPVLIISSDKDFLQLQKYDNVKQYSPMKRRFITTDDPDAFLKDHILRGDVSDGIPNFLSSDDVFMIEGKRQTPLRSAKVDVWMNQEPEEFCDDKMLRNYYRNKTLIDLSCIPEDIEKAILDEYEKEPKGARNKLHKYFIKNRLKHLTESIGEF